MSIRVVILLFLALGTAAATAMFAKNWLAQERAQIMASVPSIPVARQSYKKVMVAKTDLIPGSFVDKSKLEWQDWPEDALGDRMLKKGDVEFDDFVGSVVRVRVPAGQPVLPSAMVKAGENGFLAAVLAPGMRAVTVPLSASSGVGGFVFPGDKVDLLLTIMMKKDKGNEEGEKKVFTETLLKNVRVIGKDQVALQENGVAKIAKTATLEVSPKEAEKVALAITIGSLSLSLRSLAEEEVVISENLVPTEMDENGLKQKIAYNEINAEPIQRLELTDEMSLTTDKEVNFYWQKMIKDKARYGGGASRQVHVQRGDKTTIREFK